MLCDDFQGWNGLRGGREALKGRNIGIPIADSPSCTAETVITF